MKYIYGGKSDKGFSRTKNEDFIQGVELDEENVLCIIADGAGSHEGELQPGQIVCNEIELMIRRLFEQDKRVFLNNVELIMKESILMANRVLGGFKMGNEERFGGFAASVSMVLADEDGYLTYAHTGNTRIYLMCPDQAGIMRLTQLTKDQTGARKLLDEGKIDEETYYAIPERLKVYGGIGVALEPEIETGWLTLERDDIILLTTDGIHYAIRPEAMAELFINASNCQEGIEILIKAAISEQYPDNASGIAIFYPNKP